MICEARMPLCSPVSAPLPNPPPRRGEGAFLALNLIERELSHSPTARMRIRDARRIILV